MKTGMSNTAENQLWPWSCSFQDSNASIGLIHMLGLFSTRTEKEILQLRSFIWECLQKDLSFYSRTTQTSQLLLAMVLEPENEHRVTEALMEKEFVKSEASWKTFPEANQSVVTPSKTRRKMIYRGCYFYQPGWLIYQKCLLSNRCKGRNYCYTNSYGRVAHTEPGNLFSH